MARVFIFKKSKIKKFYSFLKGVFFALFRMDFSESENPTKPI